MCVWRLHGSRHCRCCCCWVYNIDKQLIVPAAMVTVLVPGRRRRRRKIHFFSNNYVMYPGWGGGWSVNIHRTKTKIYYIRTNLRARDYAVCAHGRAFIIIIIIIWAKKIIIIRIFFSRFTIERFFFFPGTWRGARALRENRVVYNTRRDAGGGEEESFDSEPIWLRAVATRAAHLSKRSNLNYLHA